MNPELLKIQQQRAALQAQIAIQREQIAQLTQPWKIPLSVVDRGLGGIRWLFAHPLVLVGGTALLLLRIGGVVGLLMGAWRGWHFYRRTKTLFSKIRNT